MSNHSRSKIAQCLILKVSHIINFQFQLEIPAIGGTNLRVELNNHLKRIILICLILTAIKFTYGIDLKDALQGKWLCTEIVDINSQPTYGKFGASDEYLKFSFNKNKLSITESAFDPSILEFTIKYGLNYIDLIPGTVYKIPEQVYYVKNLSDDKLILSTLNPNGDSIFYHLISETVLTKEFNPGTNIIDLGLVVIKHLKLYPGNGINRVSQYIIPNTREFLNPSPMFNDREHASFGHFYSFNFKFPDSFPTDSLTNEIIVDFDIKTKDIENIEIVQGVNSEFDKEVKRTLELTKKKWVPLRINDVETECRVRFHFVFYLGIMNVPMKGN